MNEKSDTDNLHPLVFFIDKISSYNSNHNEKLRVERMKKTTEYLLSITKQDQNGNFLKGIFQYL